MSRFAGKLAAGLRPRRCFLVRDFFSYRIFREPLIHVWFFSEGREVFSWCLSLRRYRRGYGISIHQEAPPAILHVYAKGDA